MKKIKLLLYQKRYFCLLFGILSLLVLFELHGYIIKDKYFLFTDTGYDSYYQRYPYLLDAADDFHNHLKGKYYNFNNAYGGEQSIKLSLDNWYIIFGREHVAYMMLINHILKIFLAGIFFYLFASDFVGANVFSVMAGVCYAFCGRMVILSSWQSYPNEIVVVALWLWAFERFFRKNKPIALLLSSIFFFMNMTSSYYRLLYFGIFSVYIVFRYVTDEKPRKEKWKPIFYLLLMLVIALLIATKGSFLSAVAKDMSSERAQSGMKNTSSIKMQWKNMMTPLPALIATFLRTIGLAIGGVNGYFGEYSYSKDGTFYCGIFFLPLILLAYKRIKGKKKIGYTLGFLSAFVYIFITPIREIVEGFGDKAFRLGSLWIVILMFLVVLESGNLLETKINKKEFILLESFMLLLLMTALLIFAIYHEKLRYRLFAYSCGFIILYMLVFMLLYKNRIDKKIIANTVLALTCIEIALLSYDCFNARRLIEDIHERDGYNDYTVEALQYISEKEEMQDYRVDKQYRSVYLCDALAFGYNGTSAYRGGTGIGDDLNHFIDVLGLPKYDSVSKQISSISGLDEVNAFLGTKYILSKEQHISSYDYEELAQFEDVTVYRNNNPLSYIQSYDTYITQNEFEKLSEKERQRSLLKACIVETDVEGLKQLTAAQIENESITKRFDDYKTDYTVEGNKYHFKALGEDEVLVVKAKLEKDSEGFSAFFFENSDNLSEHYFDEGYKSENDKDIPYYSVHAGINEYFFEVNQAGTDCIWFSDDRDRGVELAVFPQSIYYENYIKDIEERSKCDVDIDIFNEKEVSGMLEIANDSILCFTVPYTESWVLYVDEQKVETYKVDYCFIGADIAAGKHRICFKFET